MQTDEPVTHVGEPGSARQEHWFLRLCARINALCYHWDNYQRLAAAEKAQGEMSRQWLDAEQETWDLRERVRELEGRQGETLPERVRREAAMTSLEQEAYRQTWESTWEGLKDVEFAEEPRTIGTREPGRRDKAPTWKQHRYRVADEGHGLDRIKAPFGMTEGQARGNRARILTTGELAARFDRATQAAREIADEQE